MILGQYSDIQVFLTEYVGMELTENILSNITKTFIQQKVDVVACVGDIFDKKNPKESERLLISNHFIDILKIPTLKYFLVILGNHDYEDETKTQEINKASNPIDTLTKIIDSIDPELRKKIVYLKHQHPHEITDLDMVVFPYSLEDGKSNGDKIQQFKDTVDYNKLNITMHHDITYEYIEESKLPLTQRKKDSLIHVNSDQFFTDIILGGDIHQHYTILGNSHYPNRKYFYTGNVFERNFGEGSYSIIRKTLTQKPSYIRGLNIHHIEQNDIIKTEFVELPKLIGYLTIDVNTNRKVDDLNHQLNQVLKEYVLGEKLNFIRFKLAQMYAPIENKLREFVKLYFTSVKPTDSVINVEFIYDKSDVHLSNGIVEMMKLESIDTELKNNTINQTEYDTLKSIIVDGVDVETAISECGLDVQSETFSKILNENMHITDIISDDNVNENLNNILLSKERVINLFKLQLNTHKPSILKQVGSSEAVDKIILEINTRFATELEKYYKDNTQYSVNLLSVYCNTFCRLGDNKIDLNIIGLTRINGSNGVGKTQLYRLIRYMIKGMIYPNLPKNQSVKNTSLIFDIFNPNNDFSHKILEFTVNGTLVKLTRNDTRIWKSSAIKNEALKADTNWVKYIETINRETILEINGEKEYNPDIIQQKLDLWFGDVVDTTMIIDKFTIPDMLNKGGNDLRGLVMEHLAPYLNHLEDDLRNVKDEYKIVKPSLSLAEIYTQNTVINNAKTEHNNNIEINKKSIEECEGVIKHNELLRENIKKDLITIGDVESNYNIKLNDFKNKKTILADVNRQIEEFQPKEEPKFELQKPIKNVELIDELTKRIYDNKLSLESHEKRNLEIVTESSELTSNLNVDYTKKANEHKHHIGLKLSQLYHICIDVKNNMDNKLTSLKHDIVNYESDLKIVFNNRVNDLKNARDKANDVFNDYLSQVNKLKHNVNNSFCHECNRDFDETDTEHIEKSKLEIERLTKLKEEQSIVVNNKTTELYNYQNGDQNYIKSVIDNSVEHKEHYELLCNKLTKFETLLSHQIYINFLKLIDSLHDSNYDISLYPTIKEIINAKILRQDFIDVYEGEIGGLVMLYNNRLEDIKSIKNHPQLVEYTNELMKLVNTVSQLRITIKNDEEKLNEINTKFETENNNYTNGLVKFNEDVIEVNKHNKSIHEKQAEVKSLKLIIETIEGDLNKLENDKTRRAELVEEDNHLIKTIKENNDLINSLKNKNDNILNEINDLDFKLVKLDELEQDNIEYLHNSIIYKTYETMIKKSFKSDVFSYYQTFLNSTLNLLLEDSKFKLVWYEDGELYYSEVRDGKVVNIPVIMVSGMQQIFLGLSLIFTLSLLNTRTNLNVMFIDEISGSLNNGKGLKHSKDIIDYQDQLLMLLFKFKNKNMFMIDHVIENLYETESYEVILTEHGSKYIKN